MGTLLGSSVWGLNTLKGIIYRGVLRGSLREILGV